MSFILSLVKHLFQWQKYNFFYNKQQILFKKCIFFLIVQQKLCRNEQNSLNLMSKQNNKYNIFCVIYAIKK